MEIHDWGGQKPIPQSRISDRKTLVVGHRGASGHAPENTMSAFDRALQLGADGIEFDVQRSSDGHLVIFHDENLKRTTGTDGALRHLTFEDLRKADTGSWFSDEFRGERIPSIEELFDFLHGNDLLIFLELKDPFRYPGIEEEVARLIHEYDLVERSQVRSFHHDVLHTLYEFAPEIAISELWFDRVPHNDEVHFRTIDCPYTLYTKENIRLVRGRGQQATAWVVNDMEAAQRLIEWGIDAIATDYPDQVLAQIG
jgi:glycerophosphoryl diester phosphodiesterase